ncbi:MAG: hypothetical protein HY033_02435 [Ignavibacteriae bacterium]|nr:hypothetical protein [Ignavibacteria bacterium]MBI3363745.1 hypothetical protein [Ignavibacteriota bacterium]
MKLFTYTLLPLLVTWSVASSQVIEPGSFKASNDGADVIVSWKTIDETNVREFQIERRSSDEPDYKVIGTVSASKQSPYAFRDHTAFKKTTGLYYYRLITVFLDDTRQMFNEEAGIDHTVSGVRRTWGSIKSMFRF